MPVLNNREIWKKWAARDLAAAKNVNLNWAPLPPPLQITEVVPTSAKGGVMWNYTTTKPISDWFATDYNSAAWKTGEGGFGAEGPPGAVIRTNWKTSDIWARREFTLTEAQLANRDRLQLTALSRRKRRNLY